MERRIKQAFLRISCLIFLFSTYLIESKAQVCSTNVQLGQNLVVNGDFSAGETGFGFTVATNCSATLTTACPSGNGYRNGFVKCGSACYSSPGVIWVGDSSGYFNQSFNSGTSGFLNPLPDHSPSSDNKFLMVDGSCTSGIDAWNQSVALTASTNYYFEAWVMNLSGATPAATLQFVINGNSTNPTLSSASIAVSATKGVWQLFTATFNSGANTSATIRIQNTTTTGCGSAVDFGIDDITLTPGCQFGATGPQPALGPDQSFCGSGGSIVLNSGIAKSATTTFTWSTGATGTGTGAGVPNTLTITAPGTYAVCVTDNGSCVKSDVITITSTYTVNIGSDFVLCNPGSKTLDAVFTGVGVTYQWQKLVSGVWTNLPGVGAQGRTYTVNLPGSYKVVVNEPSCGQVISNIVNVTTQQTATPNNVFFCPTANVNLSVSGPGSYNWYSTASSSTALATGINTYTAPSLTGTTTFYVEDATTFHTTVGKPNMPSNGNAGGANDKALVFAAGQSFTIDSVTVYWSMNNNNPNDALKIQFILTNDPSNYNTTATTLITSGTWSSTNALAQAAGQVKPSFPTTGVGTYAVTVPVGITVPAAGNYRLGMTNVTTGNIYVQAGGTMAFPYNDAATGGSIATITSSKLGNNPVTVADYDVMFNWKISYKLNCARVPVIATADCSLPVDFINVSARQNNSNVLVSWVTGTEENTDYFEIFRSDDGINFTSIGKVKAAGNSNSIKSYSYQDYTAINGTVYYKIIEYDIDGATQISKTVSISDNNEGIIVYPNPAEDVFILAMKTFLGENIDISLINTLGQVVVQKQVNSDTDFLNESINVSNLSPGTYFIQVRNNHGSWTKKILKK